MLGQNPEVKFSTCNMCHFSLESHRQKEMDHHLQEPDTGHAGAKSIDLSAMEESDMHKTFV